MAVGILLIALLFVPLAHLRAQQTSEPTVKVAERDYANDPYWQMARKEVYKSTEELLAQHQTELRRGWKLHTLLRGDTHEKLVALTFDDGPHPQFTPQLLQMLRKEKVPATFFVVGEMAEKYPDLIKAEVADGHLRGQSYVSSREFDENPSAGCRHGNSSLRRCAQTHHRPHAEIPAPPGGDYDKDVAETADVLGYTTVLWTDDPGDYASPGDPVIFQRIMKSVNPGGIILLHDGIQETIDILPNIITTLRQRGYRFVTVDELMRSKKIKSNSPAVGKASGSKQLSL